jgi:hypothetical protein
MIERIGRMGRVQTIALFAILGSLMCQGAVAKAASPAPTQAPIVQSVVDCRKVDDGAQRLACYDKAVDNMAQAQAKGDLVTMDRQQRQAVHRQAFGLNIPALSMLYGGGDKEGNDKISAKIAASRQGGDGKWTIVLDDGAVWVQIDDNDLVHKPHEGSVAEIRRAMLGSFFMNIDGQLAIRVHRQS